MAAARRSHSPQGVTGWFVTGIALLALVAAGFAVGMVAGVVWEEPELVFAYITGDTEEVAWNADVAGVPERQLAVQREVPVDPQVRREQRRAVARTTPPVAAAPVGRLAVQVGAFGTSEAAQRLAGSLRKKGFPVYVSPGTKAGESRWRVRVGPLATREEAEGAATKLKKVEKLPTWILNEDAS